MKNFVSEGKYVELAAPAAVSSGDAVKIGSLFCIATKDYANGERGIFATEGIFTLKKQTALVVAEGDIVDWDEGNKELVVDGDAASDIQAGIALEALGAVAGNIKVLLKRG
jgi:predicted RecA/RadA family phage recombinase